MGIQRALQRLAISRERMRAHLHEASSPDRGEGEGKSHPVLDALMSIPGAGIVVEAVRGWWSQHPLHLATLVAADATRTLVRPFARRNPFVLVAGAVAVGGLIFWLKPWRGFLRPALLAGLLPQLVSQSATGVKARSQGDEGRDGLALQLMRLAYHGGLGHSGMVDQRAFHFHRADAMAGDVEHVVHSPEDPVVTILIALHAVAVPVHEREVGAAEAIAALAPGL